MNKIKKNTVRYSTGSITNTMQTYIKERKQSDITVYCEISSVILKK